VKGTVLTVAIWSMVTAVPAAADDAVVSPQPPDASARMPNGRALYARHCSHCHGFNMVTPGTVAFDLRRFPRDQKPRFVESVTQGRNNRMPPWRDVLTPEQIDALWAYVSTGGKS
jgi:cytochrome c55X